jgi:hypothetical protein
LRYHRRVLRFAAGPLLAATCTFAACSTDVSSFDDPEPDDGGGAGSSGAPVEDEVCSAFLERPAKVDVVVRYINNTDRILWEGHELGACDEWFPLAIAGEDMQLRYGPTCDTCQGRVEGDPACDFGCLGPGPKAIAPGEWSEHVWPGVVVRPDVAIPDGCGPIHGYVEACPREEAAGPLTLRGTLYSEKVDESKVGGERFDVDVAWMPGQTFVEIVFD